MGHVRAHIFCIQPGEGDWAHNCRFAGAPGADGAAGGDDANVKAASSF